MMKTFKIYFSEDSDLIETEIKMKEWRGDVLISCDDYLYQIEFITINRIGKEFEFLKANRQTYWLNNTVVVEKVDRETIIRKVRYLVENNIIRSFSTIDLKQFYSNAFPELQDINNWKQVY